MDNYQDTQNYWDKVFDPDDLFDPYRKTGIKELDESIEWIATKDSSIIDFGCGNGRLLFYGLHLGAAKVTGIDVSKNAVALANGVAQENGITQKCAFIKGGLEKLEALKDTSFEGAILFNILDNLEPKDTLRLASKAEALLKPKGRLIVKLNPYLDNDYFQNNDYYQELSKNFYKEKSGLFLHNIGKEYLLDLFPSLSLQKEVQVHFKKHKVTNRLYYFTKN